MFKCQVTNRMSKRGEKVNKIVTLTRERVYTKRVRNEETLQLETIEVGRGWEIVKEINATADGLAIWNGRRAAEALLDANSESAVAVPSEQPVFGKYVRALAALNAGSEQS